MMRIDGNGIADGIMASLRSRPAPDGVLACVSIGGNPASRAFVARKRAAADALGISFALHDIPADADQAACAAILAALSRDSRVRGIVLQLPLPAHFGRDALIALIDRLKDVDNLTGRAPAVSPAVLVVREILSHAGCALSDFRQIAVIGRGFLVGAPIIRWLEKERAPHAVVDIGTPEPDTAISAADLVISGVGKTGVVGPAAFRDGAGFIDFGFPPDADQYALAAQAARLRFHTMTPGGTGPILVAKLFENLYSLSEHR